jgi:hypothetical protein
MKGLPIADFQLPIGSRRDAKVAKSAKKKKGQILVLFSSRPSRLRG